MNSPRQREHTGTRNLLRLHSTFSGEFMTFDSIVDRHNLRCGEMDRGKLYTSISGADTGDERSLEHVLLQPSMIGHGNPLLEPILDSIEFCKANHAPPPPAILSGVDSCDTESYNGAFYSQHLDTICRLSEDEILSFLHEIDIPGILILAGFGHTIGGDTAKLPPPLPVLEEAFFRKYKNTKLTCGARALTKHALRDSSGYWGKYQGPVDEVNGLGASKFEFFKQNSVWHNIIFMPLDGRAYEIREADQHGARWKFLEDGSIAFLGFVEPPQQGGYENKYRH